MAETSRDLKNGKLFQDEKDAKLCKEMVEVLGRDGPQRVELAGGAGIGKTRLAKMVGEHVTGQGLCFLTLCLHLNKKYDDEWSLYENIASQLSVYSDFEESEVDDRDEDEEEEKKPDALLEDLKKKIIKEIKDKEEELQKKIIEEEEKAKKVAEDNNKAGTNVKGTGNKNAPAAGIVADNKPADGEKKDVRDPYLLLILDDEGSKKTTEDAVMKTLNLEEFLRKQDFLKDQDNRLKILVTKRKGEEDPTKAESTDTKSEQGNGSHSEDAKNDSDVSDGGIKSLDGDSVQKTEPQDTDNTQVAEHVISSTGPESKKPIELCITDKSECLLNSINQPYNLDYLFVSLMKEEDWKTYENLISPIVEKSKNSPAAIVVLAKSLNQISQSTSDPGKKEELKQKIEKKIQEVLSADRPESAVNPILHLSYELLETGFPLKEAIVDCFWHSLDFFEHCGCVYYRDLITQWILEGYFDPVKSVEKAFQDGHSILMELINRGMLKIQENNVVVPERAMSNLIDPRRPGLFGRSRLRFSRVYCGDKKKGIGKITQIDDMIKTVQARKGDTISTILVSGDRLRRETPEKYFKKLDDLEVLGLFEPTLEPFIPSFLKLLKLRVLVIRDCDLLTDIEELEVLKGLHALEVSGASSLKKISDEFFKAFLNLQSLHLSGLQITSSPSSISLLKELHCLIIKDCPLLEDLPDIQELVKLEVVDISGALGLQTCFDNTKGDKKNKSKNKNFYHLEQLQLLDFSESQIERLPIFQDSADPKRLHRVKRLLLRNCSKLRRLPSLKPLSGLQILDLSGTTSLVEMLEVCFEDKLELKTLNLSGTNLGELATTIEDLSNLNELLLKNCTNLEVIPNIQKLANLEVIDVSGCANLGTIEGSFENMSYLREINLSGTKVTIPPKLPKETKLSCQKRITLADKRSFEGKDWKEVEKKMPKEVFENASSSDTVVESQETSGKEAEEIIEAQSNEPRASDCTEKEDVSKERLHQVPIDREIYKKILSLFDSASQRFKTIHESKDLCGEAQANANFVYFVDINSTRLKSIFSKTKSVKGCSLRVCMDIKDLFSGVDEEGLGSLETLSIIDFPLLETINWGVFKNLKNLSIEWCPEIKMLSPEASKMPSTLENLHIKHCEKLEKIVEGELSTLTKLTWKVEHCPNFTGTPEGSGWEIVEHPEASN